MFYLKLAFAVISSALLAQPGSAQIIRKVPPNFKLDGDIGEWTQMTLPMPQYSGGYTPMWIAQSGEGIVFAGSSTFVAGGSPANDRSELATKGRVELWASVGDPIEMPPIAWVGDEPLTEEDCNTASYGDSARKQSCVQWLSGQLPYRERLQKLLTRMWRIAPGVVEETYATKNYELMTEWQRKLLALLKPVGQPDAKFIFDATRRSFSFEILVPWDALPPADRQHLERVSLALNVVQGNAIIASTNGTFGKALDKSDLHSFALSPSVEAEFTPCKYPILGPAGERTYYLMDRSLGVGEAFLFSNAVSSTVVLELPSEAATSPVLVTIKHFTQRLAPGEYICGPSMVYRKEDAIKELPFQLGAEGDLLPINPPPSTLPVERLPSGTRLIRDGPAWFVQYQTYTMCSACPWGKLAIFALTPSGEIKEALRLMSNRVDGTNIDGYDIEISPDWRSVKEFVSHAEHWTSRTFCLSGDTYRQCGEDNQSPGPEHGLLPPN